MIEPMEKQAFYLKQSAGALWNSLMFNEGMLFEDIVTIQEATEELKKHYDCYMKLFKAWKKGQKSD